MRRLFATMVGLVLATGIGLSAALAQGGAINQVRISEAQVKGFIAAQKDLAPMSAELQKAAESGNISPALQSKLDAVAKKHGFKSLTELDDVTDNIQMIMSGIDPQSGEFKMSTDEIKKELQAEIDEIKKDTSIPADEKKQLIAEREAGLKTAGEIKYPDNIALVKKYSKQIEEALQQ